MSVIPKKIITATSDMFLPPQTAIKNVFLKIPTAGATILQLPQIGNLIIQPEDKKPGIKPTLTITGDANILNELTINNCNLNVEGKLESGNMLINGGSVSAHEMGVFGSLFLLNTLELYVKETLAVLDALHLDGKKKAIAEITANRIVIGGKFSITNNFPVKIIISSNTLIMHNIAKFQMPFFKKVFFRGETQHLKYIQALESDTLDNTIQFFDEIGDNPIRIVNRDMKNAFSTIEKAIEVIRMLFDKETPSSFSKFHEDTLRNGKQISTGNGNYIIGKETVIQREKKLRGGKHGKGNGFPKKSVDKYFVLCREKPSPEQNEALTTFKRFAQGAAGQAKNAEKLMSEVPSQPD